MRRVRSLSSIAPAWYKPGGKDWLILLLIVLFVSPSCDRGHPAGMRDVKKDQGIHRKVVRGPVTVLLHADHKELTIAGRLNLRIEVTAGEDYEVKLPRLGEKLDRFGIVDYHTSQPELLNGNRVRITRSYVLEPFLSGDYTIPSMKIRFRDRHKKEAKTHTIETGTLAIHVKSLLPAETANLRIHEIEPPVAMPGPWKFRLWAVGGAVAVAALLGCLWWRRRRPGKAGDLVIPTHERAYRELDDLLADDLVGRGEIKRFYQRVTEILRRYIEDRFGIHAPGQTTQEFMDGLRSSNTLNRRYRPLLKAFLCHCDLVKFAEFQPADRDIRRTFDSCRTFIRETEEDKDAKTQDRMHD